MKIGPLLPKLWQMKVVYFFSETRVNNEVSVTHGMIHTATGVAGCCCISLLRVPWGAARKTVKIDAQSMKDIEENMKGPVSAYSLDHEL